MHRKALNSPQLAALAVAVALTSATANGDPAATAHTTEAVIIPDGEFSAPDGRPGNMDGVTAKAWRLTAALADRVIARLKRNGRDTQIDYDHASEDAEKVALGQAPASGWIDFASLRYEAGRGIVALLKWTPRAATAILANEYKFLSPIFLFHPTTGDVLALKSVALTNDPAMNLPARVSLTAMAALGADFDFDPNSDEGDETVNLKVAICAALALAPETTDETLATAVASLKSKADTPDPTKFVALTVLSAEQAAHAAVKTQLAALQTTVNTQAVSVALTAAKAEGVELTEALEAHLTTMGASQGIEAVKSMLTAMPRNPAKAGQLQTQAAHVDPQKTAAAVAVLSQSQKDMARTLGLSEAAYLAQLNVYRERGLTV